MFLLTKLFGGLFMGWCIGANDSANIFGTAVATNSVKYRTAIILIAVFALVGSFAEGPKLYPGYKFSATKENISENARINLAFLCTFAAAVTVMGLTYLGIPVSTSQAAVGGLMGIAILADGVAGVQWGKLGVWVCCWVINPVGSGIIAFAAVKILGPLLNKFVTKISLLNLIYRIGLVIFGCYGAYALGANNVVVTTGPFYQAGLFGNPALHKAAVIAASIGGACIAIGAITYSKNVMLTVGQGITALDPFSALVAVLAHSVAMHVFTQIHVPVSSSQAIVGAVAGIGLTKGMRTINSKTLYRIFSAWLLTPIIAGMAAVIMAYAMGLGR